MTLPLALLHGFTGSPVSFAPVLDALGPVDAFLPRLVGHGDPADAAVGSFDAEVDRLAELLSARASRWALAGYSLGGRLALGLLVRHEALFGRAVLIGAQPGLAAAADRRDRATADEAWCQLLETEGISAFADAWQRQPLFATQADLPGPRLEAQRRERIGHDPRGLARSLRVTGLSVMPDLMPQLRGVQAPTTWMAGERDVKFRGVAERMAAALPGARAEIVPGAGHNLPLERPGEVARVLRAELERA